jgi:hypothetical protein
VKSATPATHKAIFVAFNAPFDWMYINEYFQRYLGENPFGHSSGAATLLNYWYVNQPQGKSGHSASSILEVIDPQQFYEMTGYISSLHRLLR